MRAMTREEAARQKEEKSVDAPRYLVSLKLVGVAPTDVEVSRYIAELNAHPLLQDVTLEYSEERKIEGAKLRQFEIKMKLNPKIDVRDVAPLIDKSPISDPMSDEMKITPPSRRSTASAVGGGGG